MELYFSDHFGVTPDVLEEYGAFDVSVVSDLPLFVDPFLLFNGEDPAFQTLHDGIVDYLKYLRDQAGGVLDKGTMRDLYCFAEVKENWFGFTEFGNGGRGLGPEFARALHAALGGILKDFGDETITEGSHLEKVTLIGPGVGQDNISDFTTNLIKAWLCDYTQTFARKHIAKDLCADFNVTRAEFNFTTQSWATHRYYLPRLNEDFVLLTPMAMLTRHETWINHSDMLNSIHLLPDAVSDAEQRAKMNRYLAARLGADPSAEERQAAAQATIRAFPELIDIYIKLKEDNGDRAKAVSAEEVSTTRAAFVEAVKAALSELDANTDFFSRPWTSFDECLARVQYFKSWMEEQDGYRLFNSGGREPLKREKDLQLAFGLVWGGTELDVNREVNNGRGPVDFKASYGKGDKSLIEFKLASNTSLKRNLENQVRIYEAANGTRTSVKVIVCFTAKHQARVAGILKDLGLDAEKSVVVIDARADNKPSASKA